MRERRRLLLIVLAFLLLVGVVGAIFLGGDDEPRGPSTERRGTGDREKEGESATPSAGATADAETKAGKAEPGNAGTSRESEGGGDTEEEEFSFETKTPYSVTVRVVGPDGKPLESRASILDPGAGWSYGNLPKRGLGSFSGHLPEPGTYTVEAEFEGTLMHDEVSVSDGKPDAGIEIRYPGTGSVSGTVYGRAGTVDDDVKGERWVAGQMDLTVELILDRDAERPAALLSSRVDDQGRYRVGAVPPGSYIVRVRTKFHASRTVVEESEHVVHDIHLKGGSIRGRVTDRDSGEPLTNVQVVIQMSEADRARTELLRRGGFAMVSDRFRPDEDGYYAFTNLPPGEYMLFSNGLDHAPQRKTATLGEDGGDVTVNLELERGSRIDIAIQDLEGNPVEQPLWISQGMRCGFVGTVHGLRVGTHDFTACGVGFEVQTRKGVVFEPGKATKLEFKLAPEVATKLFFRDPDGRPVAGVRVSVPRAGGDLQAQMDFFLREQGLPFRQTGADGMVHVRGVRAGPVRVVAKKSGFALVDETLTLKEGRDEIAVPMKPADTTFTWRVRITRVGSGTAAARAGLQPGDVVVSYDGIAIDSAAALPRAIEAAKAKETVTVRIERDGQALERQIAPGVLGVGTEEVEE